MNVLLQRLSQILRKSRLTLGLHEAYINVSLVQVNMLAVFCHDLCRDWPRWYIEAVLDERFASYAGLCSYVSDWNLLLERHHFLSSNMTDDAR